MYYFCFDCMINYMGTSQTGSTTRPPAVWLPNSAWRPSTSGTPSTIQTCSGIKVWIYGGRFSVSGIFTPCPQSGSKMPLIYQAFCRTHSNPVFRDGLHLSDKGNAVLFRQVWPLIDSRTHGLPQMFPDWKDLKDEVGNIIRSWVNVWNIITTTGCPEVSVTTFMANFSVTNSSMTKSF